LTNEEPLKHSVFLKKVIVPEKLNDRYLRRGAFILSGSPQAWKDLGHPKEFTDHIVDIFFLDIDGAKLGKQRSTKRLSIRSEEHQMSFFAANADNATDHYVVNFGNYCRFHRMESVIGKRAENS
jgi:hypothetical protein